MLWMEWVVAGIGVVYSATSIGYAHKGEFGFAVMYMGYALANAGLIWAAIHGRML